MLLLRGTATYPNETPSLLPDFQIKRHCQLVRARSKERANALGIAAEDGTSTHTPKFVILKTVQLKTAEQSCKMIVASFNTRVR